MNRCIPFSQLPQQDQEIIDTFRRMLVDQGVDWERCGSCGRQYEPEALCAEHRLCAVCHPPFEPSREKP